MLETKEPKVKKISNGTVVTPKGFSADGVHAGLRHAKKDIGIVLSEVPANSAAVYTKSHFQAPPLKVTQESIAKDGLLQAIIVNSAIANACTGEQGLKDAYEMRASCAKKFNLKDEHVAVASTGVIGEYLKMDKINKGISELNPTADESGAEAFQTAILTTDLVMKTSCYEVEIDGKKVVIGGTSKGSGMIHPNMATMLAFVTTDAKISSSALHKALREITDVSFNQITVDGETSTNDMVVVMANGLAENNELTETHPQWSHFAQALQIVCEELAKQIAKDGEGATKLIEVEVKGAKSKEDANIAAKKIVGSSLVKTAVYGADANWGRIIGAVGHSDVSVNPDKIEIYLEDICMFTKNSPQPFDEEAAKKCLENDKVRITVNLGIGEASGRAWGCDLTYDYIKINASYRT
ncbi:bifunctional ornithine acetyltransferase/N-acetylglutamate synthase [Metabacillus fastidiosus]|uniref:Arginine biosynthesis bifunctional protein ArgJ n=1 Tax=Metabacillus fastidiosus TaxID=1458 RepID=A0ABU6P268_9BACI|nr:bifunctional ornithine acetyltransferase/N-acetylglutamate synthase [Metabacillus fastidiosus]MED4403165.1 bifunctional ornithine acetyltransferase/N-acetylglutamate synthase [Metabacillus fastidiosus]MED4455399.1 bifunctional ornithine acetyltransferase/N-acetylglutamate synthase [Metabacillus fastidiosus]MED4461590.1 bifunctional ornithine acetyltransferase/N-acetylglutamate synthase [Metabacillus fastidiosus]